MALSEAVQPGDEIVASIDVLDGALGRLPAADATSWRATCEPAVGAWRQQAAIGGGAPNANSAAHTPSRPAPTAPAPQRVATLQDRGPSADIETVKVAVNRMRAVQTLLRLDPPRSPKAESIRVAMLQAQPDVLAHVWSVAARDEIVSLAQQNLCVKFLVEEAWGSRELTSKATWLGVQVGGQTALAVYDEARDGLTNVDGAWSLHETWQVQLELVHESGEWRIARQTELLLSGTN